MYKLRQANINDLEGLYELSLLLNFINLPPDKKRLQKQLESAEKSFLNPHNPKEESFYIFVLENPSNGDVIGSSMIHGKHGTEKEPHFYLSVDKEQKYSQTLNTGFIHGTLKFGYQTDGLSEIGGLVVNPEMRAHPDKLGKQLSYIRFLYMGMFTERFTETIHCELMPPFDAYGNSPLWEAIGRRFLNMNYQEADKLSRENKEFILSLYPINTI